jgi:hypothetical protein
MKTPLFILFTLLVSFAPLKVKAQNSNEERKKIDFYDKHAYKTASDMYAVAETMPFDEDAYALIKEITRMINQGLPIENNIIWKNLQELEPYRMTPRVQAAVKIWVEASAKRIQTQSVKQVALTSLQSVSQAYNSRDFEKTVQASKTILSDAPKHFDIRSNMALALMHQNRDLCAQIELEIIHKLSDKHVPSLLNLTVLYERMKLRREAEEMVSTLKWLSENKKIDIPMARYNDAWFQFQNGNSRYANTLHNRAKR